MKKNLLFLMVLPLFFVSCNKDPKVEPESEIKLKNTSWISIQSEVENEYGVLE
jgi:hypothetical protein